MKEPFCKKYRNPIIIIFSFLILGFIIAYIAATTNPESEPPLPVAQETTELVGSNATAEEENPIDEQEEEGEVAPTPSCEDTDTFEVKGKTRECSWVASKKEKRCKKFSDYCPVTCETCPAPAPVPSPMASPVPVDPTQAPNCEDLDTFEDSKGKTRTCSWVGKKEKQRCKKFSDFCPVTCDVCETHHM